MTRAIYSLATALLILSVAPAGAATDDFETGLGVDGSFVTSRIVDGVTVTISTTSGANLEARTYNAASPLAFGGLASAPNAPLTPANVSGTRFISTNDNPVGTFDQVEPITFTFSSPVCEFQITTLDILENGVSPTDFITLEAYDAVNTLVVQQTRTGAQGASGLDLDWKVTWLAGITRVELIGVLSSGTGYGLDDMVVVPTSGSGVGPQIVAPRYLTNQDIPETNIPDFSPPSSAASGNITYTLHSEDFELGANGWTTCDRSSSTTGPCGSTGPFPEPPPHGDYAALFPGLTLVQQDLYRFNASGGIWGFFSGSVFNYGCGGFPAQATVPYVNAMNQYVRNEIYSPAIEWDTDTGGAAVPAAATAAFLNFDVYADLPLDNLVFYYWRVRWLDAAMTPIVAAGSDVDGWFQNNFIYYDGTQYTGLKQWIRPLFEFGGWTPSAPSYVQVAIGVWDLCDVFCGLWGSGACHSHAPLIDHVLVTRVDPPTIWNVNGAHLFQDNFSGDGTTTGTVRVDMALDIAPIGCGIVIPGDSAAVTVTEPVNGIGTDLGLGGPAVYIHVKDIGAKQGAAISGDVSRWPLKVNAGGWTTLRMDIAYADAALTIPVPDRYCVDLADDLYVPGDSIVYYFSAVDGVGDPSYWNEFTGVSILEQDARNNAMEMTCLPANVLTSGGDILYVDAVDGGGAQPFYDWAFLLMGLDDKVDRYDVRGPSQIVNNGLSSRVTNIPVQLTSIYRKIIWDSGDLDVGSIQAGSPFKTDDFSLLLEFVDNLPDVGGIYFAGDNLANAWSASPSIDASLLRTTYMDYTMVGNSYRALVPPGLEVLVPLVVGQSGSCFDHIASVDRFVALGNGIYTNDFDVITPNASGTLEMAYNDDPSLGAVVGQQTTNGVGQQVGVMLQGFSYRFLREDRTHDGEVLEREHHLHDVITWLQNAVNIPVDAKSVALTTDVVQNYPNPFNPTTTIGFTIAKRVHVRLAVYDVAGRHVRTLVDRVETPGVAHEVTWDGKDRAGHSVASGVYFYRFEAGAVTKTMKMVMLK